MKNQWTHKVVKQIRGLDGDIFSCRTAHTGSLAQCISYAREFAAEQIAGGAPSWWSIVCKSRRGNSTVFALTFDGQLREFRP
jgi:hypothetical protein